MSAGILRVSFTGTAGADLSADAGLVMRITGISENHPTIQRATDGTIATGQRLCGILRYGAANGAQCTVDILGEAVEAIAGDTLTVGTHVYLTTDGTGRCIPITNGRQPAAIFASDRSATVGQSIRVYPLISYAPDIATMLVGALGAVDNALVRSDGAGGVTAQGSDITLSDAEVLIANVVTAGEVWGAAALNAAAIAQWDSTTRGLLIPRQTTAQRTAIAVPVEGLIVYDTDLNAVFSYDGAAWQRGLIGALGAVDNAVARVDGAGGGTLQGSALVIDDAGAITGAAGLTTTGNIVLSTPAATVDGVDLDTAIRGALGGVDNVVPRSDGVGGVTAQNSLLVITDAGAASGLTGLTMTGNITMSTPAATVDGLDLDTAIRGALGAVDNEVMRVNGAGGVTAQAGSGVTIADDGSITVPALATVDGLDISVSGIRGALGAVDNVVPRVDGAGGLTLQNSLMVVDDAGAVTGLTGITTANNIVLSTAAATVDGRDLTAEGIVHDGMRRVTMAAGAEAGNIIPVTLNVVDAAGAAVNAVTRIVCHAFSPNATTITLTETGAGALVAVSGAVTDPSIIVDTDASGDAQVSVSYVVAGAVGFVAQVAPASGTAIYGFPHSTDLNFV